MKKIFLFFLCIFIYSCADQNNRLKLLKKEFPEYKIEPAPYPNNGRGDNPTFLMSDSNNVYGVTFWIGSEKKIYRITKIK